MEKVSQYWYEKKAMPEEEKKKIKAMVQGTVIDSICLGDEKIRLLKVDGSVFR